MRVSLNFLAIFCMAITLMSALPMASAWAHPSEDELIQQLQEQYGRPRPEEDPDRQTPEEIEAARAAAAPPGLFETAGQYLYLGYVHILPKGLDHILFVLGLFFASIKLRPLLIQVTTFTVAHSVTLALAVLGLVAVPGSIVEPLIALSIAFIAIENIFFNHLTPWRPFIVFGFGLVHGLGFAGVLQEIGMPQDQLLTGLVTFNVGVELGQLTVILSAWALLHWFYRRPWYRQRIVIPVSVVIASVALFWTVQRVLLVI